MKVESLDLQFTGSVVSLFSFFFFISFFLLRHDACHLLALDLMCLDDFVRFVCCVCEEFIVVGKAGASMSSHWLLFWKGCPTFRTRVACPLRYLTG